MPATGTISLAPGQSLDFEVATSYTVSVSVYDGFRRSVTESVTINVTNLNDNVPVITAGQSFRIDDGVALDIGQGECHGCRRHEPAGLHHVPGLDDHQRQSEQRVPLQHAAATCRSAGRC